MKTDRTCNRCAATKQLPAFYQNGAGRYRPTCIACERKGTIADAAVQRQRALDMWHAGRTIAVIARTLCRSNSTIGRWLRKAGIQASNRGRPRSDHGRRGHPDGSAEIGFLSPGSPLYAVDHAILRGRMEAGMLGGKSRPTANPWPSASSLAL